MDCDRVFMILTRGPFPTGAPSDEQVEEHLETCGDCWRLAEALRPALEVFQEAIPAAEGRDLPGYWGDARPASAVLSRLTNGAGRTLMTAGVRRVARPMSGYQSNAAGCEFSADMLRAIALAATITAAAVSVAFLLRG